MIIFDIQIRKSINFLKDVFLIAINLLQNKNNDYDTRKKLC